MEAIKLQTSLLQVNQVHQIAQCFLYDSLTDHQIKEISKFFKKRTLHKGEYLYKEGDSAEQLYFLEQGSVKIYSTTFDGKEVIKNIVHAKNLIGEQAYCGTDVRLDSAKTVDPEIQVFEIHVDDFKGLIQRYWELNQLFISLMSKKLSRTEDRVKGLIVDDARKRVIDFLKYNAKHKGKKIGFELLIKHSMTQQDIANYTGTSRQTVTSILNDLRKTNMIYFKRNSILIRDIANLA